MASPSLSQYRNPLSRIALTLDELLEVRTVRRVNLRFGCICKPDVIIGGVKMVNSALKVQMASRAHTASPWVDLGAVGVAESKGSGLNQFLIASPMSMEQFEILHEEYPNLVVERSSCICRSRRFA